MTELISKKMLLNKRILVLNVEVSGMNKYLLSGLRKNGWELFIVNVPNPGILRWLALALTFSPNMQIWKRRFDERLAKLHKTAWAFMWRSRFCEKKIKQLKDKYDVIFQISGLFAPYLDNNQKNKPYVTYNDYTTALALKYPPWAPYPLEQEKWLSLENKLYRNARIIFTTNDNARQSFINDYGVSKESVITVGYGLTFDVIPEFEKVYDGKTILFIGMDFERKGGFVLLEAFKNIKEVIPEACLVIIGPPKNTLKINHPGVEMLGCIRDRKIIEDYYKKASLFAMPSLCEPFGLVFLEAMAYKLPCIGTNVDAMPEIIEDGKTGFLVTPHDSETLAEKIVCLFNSPELMRKMGEAGLKKVKDNFSWDRIVDQVDFYLRNISS